ncbi:MAG: DUF4269 domain-containing protein [bacterium]|nr:DUF4269 domain-containing protein [bacterium]
MSGTETQQRAHACLVQIGIFKTLQKYDPILVGTIPLGIETEKSDLDIICKASDLQKFSKLLVNLYSAYKEFKIYQRDIQKIPSLVCSFYTKAFEIEIFAQPIPTHQQQGYRHMVVEERLLRLNGTKFREEIRALKKEGMKTEPAFAHVLSLKGDPYLALLNLEKESDARLVQLWEIRNA